MVSLDFYRLGIGFRNPDMNWMIESSLESKSADERYLYSMFWATSLVIHLGYGDIYPTNRDEVLCSVLIMIYGFIVFVIGLSLVGQFINR